MTLPLVQYIGYGLTSYPCQMLPAPTTICVDVISTECCPHGMPLYEKQCLSIDHTPANQVFMASQYPPVQMVTCRETAREAPVLVTSLVRKPFDIALVAAAMPARPVSGFVIITGVRDISCTWCLLCTLS